MSVSPGQTPRWITKVLYFNGKDSYVEIPEPSYIAGARKLSIVAWVNPFKDYSGGWDVVTEGWNDDWSIMYGWDRIYGKISFTDNTAATLDLGFHGYTPRTWGMLFFGWDIDAGIIKGYNSWTGNWPSTTVDPSKQPRNRVNVIRIGYYNSPLLGYIAAVYIYTRLLSDSEVKQIYDNPMNPPKDGLVIWLAPDSIDCNRNIWYDKSGNNNNGKIHNATCVELISRVPWGLIMLGIGAAVGVGVLAYVLSRR